MPRDDLLPHVNEGEPLSAEQENRLRDIVRGHVNASGFYSEQGGIAGRRLSRRDPLILGEIMNEGPSGECDVTGKRYWVRLSRITTQTTGEQDSITISQEDNPVVETIVAHDFTEETGTRGLELGSWVGLRTLMDDGGTMRWLIVEKQSLNVRFGKALIPWTSGNIALLDPCSEAGVDNGRSTVFCYINMPTNAPIGTRGEQVDIAANDIMAYIPYKNSYGVLVSPCIRLPVGATGSILYMKSDAKWQQLVKQDNDDLLQLKSGLPSWQDPADVLNGLFAGGDKGDMLRHDGTKWVLLKAPGDGPTYVLLIKDGEQTWTEMAEFVCPVPE